MKSMYRTVNAVSPFSTTSLLDEEEAKDISYEEMLRSEEEEENKKDEDEDYKDELDKRIEQHQDIKDLKIDLDNLQDDFNALDKTLNSRMYKIEETLIAAKLMEKLKSNNDPSYSQLMDEHNRKLSKSLFDALNENNLLKEEVRKLKHTIKHISNRQELPVVNYHQHKAGGL